MSTVAPQPPAAAENSAPLEVKSGPGTPTWEIAHLYPPQGGWTESEYLSLDTNQLIEFTDGNLEFLPMPTPWHQLIVQYIFQQLDSFVKSSGQNGRVFVAPMPVRLSKGKYREPDVVFLRNSRLTDLRRQPDGADLAIEVVSPGEESRERDLETKRQEYAEAGIDEYWIVDPELRTITVLTLDGKKYHVHGEFAAGTTATSVLLKGFAVAVDDVFAAGGTSAAPGGGKESAK